QTETSGQKDREQQHLSECILHSGIEMLPCSICAHDGVPCVMVPEACKCSQCHSSNSQCSNVLPTLSEYEKFKQEEERLAQELIAAREAAIAAQARTIHLEKQQHSLCSCAREMLRC